MKNTSRKNITKDWLGKSVHVEIDRPVGYQHGTIVYPINYGYIPGKFAEDGEEQDAYILGTKEPLKSFDGTVIGVIRRENDREDKLVVAGDDQEFHQGQIAEAVQFQEQYFVSTIDSIFRKSCGVIPVRQNGKEKEYLIILQKNNSWSFPKGHMEAGESEIQTAKRELFEETGLTANPIIESRLVLEYTIPPYTRKQVVLFLGEVNGSVFLQESEAVNYRWAKESELKKYLHPDTYRSCKMIL